MRRAAAGRARAFRGRRRHDKIEGIPPDHSGGRWNEGEIQELAELDSPMAIQEFLNRAAYNPSVMTHSPRWVLHEKKANCFEGALFAAACLRRLGHEPLVVDLYAVNDDDHVIAVFKDKGWWGAVAKSNFTTLRFREPVYRSLRELVMSYFDFFYNTLGAKTLRSYSRPLRLTRFDRRNWMTSDENLQYIGDCLNAMKHFTVVSPQRARVLSPVDPLLFKAGLLSALPAGLFKAKRKKS